MCYIVAANARNAVFNMDTKLKDAEDANRPQARFLSRVNSHSWSAVLALGGLHSNSLINCFVPSLHDSTNEWGADPGNPFAEYQLTGEFAERRRTVCRLC
jgi:hypothetical protein